MHNQRGTKVPPQISPRSIPRDKFMHFQKRREILLERLAKDPSDQDVRNMLADLVLAKHDPKVR